MATSARLLKGGNTLAPEPLNIPTLEPGVRVGFDASKVLQKPHGDQPHIETADELLASARTEAQLLISDAKEVAERIATEARESGLREARSIIDRELQSEVADLRAQMVRSLDELEQLYAAIATRVEKDLVRLALEIARKVVHRTVTTDPDVTITLARVALERLHPRAIATVRISPEDFEWVTAHREKLGNYCTIELVSDQSVARGGCLVQSDHGDVDARIEQQFAVIEKGFFDA